MPSNHRYFVLNQGGKNVLIVGKKNPANGTPNKFADLFETINVLEYERPLDVQPGDPTFVELAQTVAKFLAHNGFTVTYNGAPVESKQTAIVVREGETGDGDVVRVLLVPDGIVDDKFKHAVTDLYEYGSQNVDYINPDVCGSLEAVEAIFNEMNPPADDEQDDDEGDDDEVGPHSTGNPQCPAVHGGHCPIHGDPVNDDDDNGEHDEE
jgi:hypothetical protein